MGLSSKVASMMMLGGTSRHAGHKPPGKAERTRAKAEKAQKKAAEAQALRTEAEAKVAKEQDAVIAHALHEDEAQRRADISELAEIEAEAIPEWPPDPSEGMESSRRADHDGDRRRRRGVAMVVDELEVTG